MKSADEWPRSEASESVTREVRKLDLGISPEQFGQAEPPQKPLNPNLRSRTFSRGEDASSSAKGSKEKLPKQTPDHKIRKKDDRMPVEPSDRDLDKEGKEEQAAALKRRRNEMKEAGKAQSMFDCRQTRGPFADGSDGFGSKKVPSTLSSRAASSKPHGSEESRDLIDLEQDTPNPWENYRKVERARYEQQVRANELERKMDKTNKEIDDRLENLKFFQRGGQRMQSMAQTRAIEKNETDKTYDMMGLSNDPEDWQLKEFAGISCKKLASSPTRFGTPPEIIIGKAARTSTRPP